MVRNLVKSVYFWASVAAFFAAQSSASVCDDAARRASAQTGVPTDVLMAITRLETGRGSASDPWPWAVNQAGDGSWFNSEDEARAFVFSRIKRGVSNIDIGCFQINYRWHSDGFRSLDDMFDPNTNALYAATFLKQLHDEFGNWQDAAGAYHSRTPQHAAKYEAKFKKYRARVAELAVGQADTPSAKPPGRRVGSGSLFLVHAAPKPFIDFGKSN